MKSSINPEQQVFVPVTKKYIFFDRAEFQPWVPHFYIAIDNICNAVK